MPQGRTREVLSNKLVDRMRFLEITQLDQHRDDTLVVRQSPRDLAQQERFTVPEIAEDEDELAA